MHYNVYAFLYPFCLALGLKRKMNSNRQSFISCGMNDMFNRFFKFRMVVLFGYAQADGQIVRTDKYGV